MQDSFHETLRTASNALMSMSSAHLSSDIANVSHLMSHLKKARMLKGIHEQPGKHGSTP